MRKVKRKYVGRGVLTENILDYVEGLGKVSLYLLTPGVVKMSDALNVLDGNPRKDEYIKSACMRLLAHGLLERNKGNMLRLSEKGKLKLKELKSNNIDFKIPLKWDKKWRMLIFDIPEHRKGTRDKIRHTLIDIGFMRLQDSVWVFPYDCEDLIQLLKADLKIGKDVLYIVADRIEYEKNLITHFRLK